MAHLFLHGLGQNADAWQTTLSALSLKQPYCPELFRLCTEQKLTFSGLYKGFSRLLEQVSAPLHLCGLSLGGMLALRYAAEHPQKVNSLVLIGAQYRSPNLLLSIQNTLFRLMPEKAFTQMGLGKEEFLSLCRSMKGLDFQSGLPKISCPVLVLCGEKDKANLAAARELARLLPCAELVLLPHAGHEVNTNAPDELAACLRAFYEKHGIC